MSTATRIATEGKTLHRAASFQPASYNADANTVDVVWTTGAAVTRFDWLDGEYYTETLATDPASVRLGRLNDGGPVLASHDDQNLGAILGSVVPGTARMQAGKGLATIRLADTPDVADAVAKVKAGHLRNVSVGYLVHTYTRTVDPAGGRDTMQATDWEPTEISLVPVPADPGCQVRSRSATDMPDIIEADPEGAEEQPAARGKPVTTAAIRQACEHGDYSRSFERELLEEHAERPFTRKALQQRLTNEYARMHNPPMIDNSIRADHYSADSRDGMARAIEDALYARMSGSKPSDQARPFMGASMAEMARGLMEQRGERARWLTPSEVMKRFANHTTSDFPNLLLGATTRYLLELYNGGASPLKALARDREVRDFRQITSLAMLPFGALRPVAEGGEYKHVTMSEGIGGYKLVTFGEIFGLTRQAFINDDLGYFSTMPQLWARAANETEAQQLAGLITANGPVMGDGQNLYSATHGNLAVIDNTNNGAISVVNLASARLAMRAQKNPDGVSPAGITPKYLVVGPAKETEAEQALAQLTAINQPSDVNPFSGKLDLIVDDHIPGNSWRLFADPANWPTLEYAHLANADRLFTDERTGWDVDGVEFKARIDFGCGPVDYRGTYKNPGN